MKEIKKVSLLIVLLVFLTACTPIRTFSKSLPYAGWSIGYVVPPGMSVWIETIDVEDVNGRVFPHVGSGTASIGYSGDAAGWPAEVGLGGGRQVTGASFPKRLYVRWQSLVEPQTYRVFLDIPESARQAMLTKVRHRVIPEDFHRDTLVVGLAPGGWVKAWVTGPAGKAIEVLCTRAEIEPKGLDQGEFGGRYVTLNERAKAYLAKHPIPYGSWDCGK